ncbi:MAG: Maf family protein [Clostridia bacterium]|nr:Maf family protein [Clostridia bacterium]
MLILASNSPRRKELLNKYGFEFEIIKSNFGETNYKSALKTVKQNALGKALDVQNRIENKSAVILGADTIVYYKGKIIGKPSSREDAILTLRTLSGKVHKVITGYAIIKGEKKIVKTCITRVVFNVLSEDFIKEYVESGKAMDKAGSYGAQDGKFVKTYRGSVNNVIGLPIEKMQEKIKKMLNIR